MIPMKASRILFIGPDRYSSISNCWHKAWMELGEEVRVLDTDSFGLSAEPFMEKIIFKLRRRPFHSKVENLNRTVLQEVRRFQPDFLFFMKADYIFASTLQETGLTSLNFVYMNDDMFNPNNQSFTFYEALPHFDSIFTTKSYNVEEYQAAGASQVFFLPNAYDPQLHFPVQPTFEERASFEGGVAFIGTFRPERADLLAQVAAFPDEFRFNLWGDGWYKMYRPNYFLKWNYWRRLKSCCRGKPLLGPEMGKAMQANKIILGLLYHANRDLQTTRSFEIPACGGFMLAERTPEHLEYFAEDREAAYYENLEEMLDKIRFFLAHDQERRRIAEAGYRRCRTSPYRYVDRARVVLEQSHVLRGLRRFAGKSR